MIIYLAGGSKSTWQDRAISILEDHEIIDPREWASEAEPKIYTKRDLDGIRRADVLVTQMDPSNPSGYGLSVELGFASALGKRIVFVDKIADDWRSRYFGMHRVMAHTVCRSLDDLPHALTDSVTAYYNATKGE